jgi:hypothetical protein
MIESLLESADLPDEAYASDSEKGASAPMTLAKIVLECLRRTSHFAFAFCVHTVLIVLGILCLLVCFCHASLRT